MLILVEAPRVAPTTPVRATPRDTRSLWFESLDGSLKVPYDGRTVKLLVGAIGLEEAPVDLATSSSPDVDGGFLDGVGTGMRQMLLPTSLHGASQAEVWASKDRLRSVLQTGRALTREGSCRLVAASSSGERELTVAYVGGLEGDDLGVPHYDRFGLRLLAVDPFPHDREDQSVEFSLGAGEVFLSNDDAHPWPRALSSSRVIGEDMEVNVRSQVPVRPRIDIRGPFGPDLTVSADTGLMISVPAGVPQGSTLSIVTDRRHQSVTLDGVLAGSRLARPASKPGSPFQPGINLLSVSAGGATEDSLIQVSWRNGYRSLW